MRKSLVFGGTSTDLLASFSPSDTNQYSCWKMSQTSFEWADPTLLEVLPQSGMTASGRLYQLHNVEHPTSDAGGLQSPTQAPLDTTCETLWNLESSLTVDGLLPTPTKTGAEHRTRYSQGGRPLMYMIQKGLLPTPSAHEHKYRLKGKSQASRCLEAQARRTGKDFQLNPLFVEEMMGFPIGWTELKHSETQSFHSAPNGSDNKS